MYKVGIASTDIFRYDPITDKNGHIYKLVEESLFLCGLDEENYDTPNWNPFGSFISSGNLVVIKPNLVMHKNYRKGYEKDVDCVYTQPSVVRPIIDYVLKAMNYKGQIIVGDAPVQECDYEILIEQSGYKELIEEYQKNGYDIKLKDFRGVVSVSDYGVLHQKANEEAQFRIVNLGKDSEFSKMSDDKLKKIRITNYDPEELLKHHNTYVQEYCIATEILDADVIINMPKPKTHKKAGMTACLKNLVGINCRKEYLPHHTMGSIKSGGDEYCEQSRLKMRRARNHDLFCQYVHKGKYIAARVCQAIIILQDMIIGMLYKDKTSFGSWAGNNTISKTIIDLNKILFYADKGGIIKSTPQRKIFNVADMVISGEHNGPMAPMSKEVGLIIAGYNSYAIDMTISSIMGIDIERLPTLENAVKPVGELNICDPKEEIIIFSKDERFNMKTPKDLKGIKRFKAPDDWEEVFL